MNPFRRVGRAIKKPFRLANIYGKADKVLDHLDEGRENWEDTKGTKKETLYETREWWERLVQKSTNLALTIPLPSEVHNMLKGSSWKTTGLGIATLAVVVMRIVNGHFEAEVDVPTILVGIGLILGKDFNVTHSKGDK